MRFAIIGYGAIGDVHAKVIESIEEAQLVAIATRNPEKQTQAAAKYHCAVYGDYREMLLRDDIDVVSICLPSGSHEEAALAVAEAGKHCIIEKPMEISADRCIRVAEAFDRKGLTLSVIFQHRFDQSTRLIKNAIDTGKMGKLNYGSARTIWFRDENYYRNSGWRGTWAADGGGALMNQAIHCVDLLYHLMGPVEAVCGNCATLFHESMETEDLGLALLKFKSGAMGLIEGTTLAYPGFFSEVNIYGQSGSVGIRNDAVSFCHLAPGMDADIQALMEKGDENIPYGWYNLLPHIRQYRDVMDAIVQRRAPLISGLEGMESVKIIEGIYRSSQKKEWVLL